MIAPDEGPAAEVLNPGGKGSVVVVCEHASNRMPRALGTLGLGPEALSSHIAWDPGALGVARHLSAAFDAPLVAARFSRLVYDCNRPPDAPDAMPARSEIYDVPGNRELSAAARTARIREIGEPFTATLAATIRDRLAARPVIVTVHSFTPVWFGAPREVELGLLHDADSRLADAMLEDAGAVTGLLTRRNEPYGPESGVTHTLKAHALPDRLLNVMIEVRNDLIAGPEAETQAGESLARLIRGALARLSENAGGVD